MKTRIQIINLGCSTVKRVYDLYAKAQKSGNDALVSTLKKSVYAIQQASCFGTVLSFPAAMRPDFDKICKKFDADCYLVDDIKLNKVLDAFVRRCIMSNGAARYQVAE